MSNLIPSFKETLFNSDMIDTIPDLADVGIDLAFNGGLNGMPIFGTIAGLCKVGANIRERNLTKQLYSFLVAFHEREIDSKILNEYRRKLEENPKRLEAELGRVLILLDRIIDKYKSKLLAKAYLELINEKSNWTYFCELADIIDRVFLADIPWYREFYKTYYSSPACRIGGPGVHGPSSDSHYRAERLVSVGLMINDLQAPTAEVSFGVGGKLSLYDNFSITKIGFIFLDLCKLAGPIDDLHDI